MLRHLAQNQRVRLNGFVYDDADSVQMGLRDGGPQQCAVGRRHAFEFLVIRRDGEQTDKPRPIGAESIPRGLGWFDHPWGVGGHGDVLDVGGLVYGTHPLEFQSKLTVAGVQCHGRRARRGLVQAPELVVRTRKPSDIPPQVATRLQYPAEFGGRVVSSGTLSGRFGTVSRATLFGARTCFKNLIGLVHLPSEITACLAPMLVVFHSLNKKMCDRDA